MLNKAMQYILLVFKNSPMNRYFGLQIGLLPTPFTSSHGCPHGGYNKSAFFASCGNKIDSFIIHPHSSTFTIILPGSSVSQEMGLAHSSTKSKDEVNPANPVFEQKKMSGISLVNEKELVEATLKFDVPLNLDGILKKSCCEFELSCSETPGQYWVRDKPSSESEFEKIAFLKTVCLLQLNGEFEGVPAGKYIAYLRANFHSNNFSLNYRVGFGYRDVLTTLVMWVQIKVKEKMKQLSTPEMVRCFPINFSSAAQCSLHHHRTLLDIFIFS